MRSRTVAAFGAVGMNSCQSLVTRYGAWFGWASTTSTSSRCPKAPVFPRTVFWPSSQRVLSKTAVTASGLSSLIVQPVAERAASRTSTSV